MSNPMILTLNQLKPECRPERPGRRACIAHRIIGFGKDRSLHDFYPTPRIAIESLLERETFSGPIWEPASGSGAISTVLSEYGYDVISTDLFEYGYGESGIDFLDASTAFPKVAS